jgi:hypothetical protein
MSLWRTLSELLHVSHCLNARLCVAYNEAQVLRAKENLADALAALDACEARARIAHHVETAPVPRYLRARVFGTRASSFARPD